MLLKELVSLSEGILIGNVDDNIEILNFSIDSRNILGNTVFIPIKGEKADGHDYINNAFENGAIGTFTNKDIELKDGKFAIRVSNTLEAMQKLAKNYRNKIKDIPLIAVTGSVGKTTTKDMMYSVLSKKFDTLKTEGNFNNEIGLPLTLLRHKSEKAIVLEMGMSNFGEISLLSKIAKPNAGVIVNIGHSHIEYLKTRENILKAKMEIIDGMSKEGILIINSDNDMLSTVKNLEQKIITFGFENKADVFAYNIEVKENVTSFCIKENEIEYKIDIALSGEKFIYNALAAWTIGRVYGISPDERVSALKNTTFTKMRMNIKNVNNYKIIDDCYNASPESVKVALNMLQKQEGNRKVAILGDMKELGDYSASLHKDIGKETYNKNVDFLIAIGEYANEIKDGAVESGMQLEKIKTFKETDEALNYIKNEIKENDVVLVKASRSMKFEKIVKTLEE